MNTYFVYIIEYGDDVNGTPHYNVPTKCSENQQSLIDLAEGYCQQKLDWKIDEYPNGYAYEVKFKDEWIRVSPVYTDKRP